MLATQNVRVKPNSDTIKDVNKKKQSKIKKYQWDFATVKRETLKKCHKIYNMRQKKTHAILIYFKSQIKIQPYRS